MLKALITDMHHKSDAEEQRVLTEAGIQVDSAMCLTEDELIETGRGHQGFLVSYAPCTRRVMEALPDLRIMVKYGIGVDNIDVEAATDLGRVVANVPDVASEEVAVHALSLLLNGLRMTDFYARSVRRSVWKSDPEETILYRVSESSLGLVGYGRIPRILAQLAKPLFGSVCVYDPYASQDAIRSDGFTPVEDLRDIFSRCPAISVHAPLNDATRGFINDDLVSLGQNTILVNTSRGGVLDKGAIVRAVKSGALAFFGADVFWTEPADFSDPDVKFLIEHDRVMITPHVAWCSQPAAAATRRRAAEEVRRVLNGYRPQNAVNPEVFQQLPELKQGESR